jgi:hypothetical protein
MGNSSVIVNRFQLYHDLRVVEEIRHYTVLREVFSRFDHPPCGLMSGVFQCLLFGLPLVLWTPSKSAWTSHGLEDTSRL